MPIGVLVLRTRNEPLWHLPWSRCHSYIRLRRVLLLRSGIRLSPSDIRYASLGGEYNITATTELQSNSEQYHCCLQQYHADTVSISLPIWYCICVYKCSACQEKRTENVKHSLSFSCQFEYTALWTAPLCVPAIEQVRNEICPFGQVKSLCGEIFAPQMWNVRLRGRGQISFHIEQGEIFHNVR